MKLFQYWDTPTPPEDVAGWIKGFKANNLEFEHVLFDRGRAERFIAEHHGPRLLAAFQACAVPAMQADYLRLCLLDTHGGLYVDADNQSVEPLAGLIEQAPSSMMLTWGSLINNGFMMFREPHNCFVRACLDLATDNIEHKRVNAVYTATGPGMLNAVRALLEPDAIPQMAAAFDNPYCRDWGFLDLIDHARLFIKIEPELRQAFQAITLVNALAAGSWIGTDQPAYKDGNLHWAHWKGSIYR